MKRNTKMTNIMRISNGKEATVNKYQYRWKGSLITNEENCHVEMKRRIAMEKDAFYKRKKLMSRKLNKNLKKQLIKSMIWSVILYGLKTWTLRKENIKRLEAFEKWIRQRIRDVPDIHPVPGKCRVSHYSVLPGPGKIMGPSNNKKKNF